MKIRARMLLSVGTVILSSALPALAEPPPAVTATVVAPPAYPNNNGPNIGGKDGKDWKDKEKYKDKDYKDKDYKDNKDKDYKEKEEEKLHEKEKLEKEKLHEKEKWGKLSDKGPGWKDPKGPPPGFDRKKWEEKRRLEREEAKKKLAMQTPTPDVSAEMKLHAYRIAELNRIGELAKLKADTATGLRVQLLVTKENGRHDRKMHKLGAWK